MHYYNVMHLKSIHSLLNKTLTAHAAHRLIWIQKVIHTLVLVVKTLRFRHLISFQHKTAHSNDQRRILIYFLCRVQVCKTQTPTDWMNKGRLEKQIKTIFIKRVRCHLLQIFVITTDFQFDLDNQKICDTSYCKTL